MRITLDLSEEAMEILKNIAPKSKSMFVSACIIEATKKNKELINFFSKTNVKNLKEEHTTNPSETTASNNSSTNYQNTNSNINMNNDDENDEPIEFNF